jgi:hypothetical protein
MNVIGYGKGMHWQYCWIQFVATFCDCSSICVELCTKKKKGPFMLYDIETNTLWELEINKINN